MSGASTTSSVYSEHQQECLSQIRALVDDAPTDMELERWASVSGESTTQLLCRFLQARKWDVKKAFNMLTEDVNWRREMKLEELVKMDPSEVMGVDSATIRRYFPCWSQGTDRLGRPVLYKSYGGNFEIWKLTEKGATVESLLRHHIYENEKNMRLLAQQPEGRRASQFSLIVEAQGWRLGLATRDAMRYLKGIADVDSAHYPERLACNIVINAPRIFSATWRLIRSWLDPVTVSKIFILGPESEWRPVLADKIDNTQLALEYGGLNTVRNEDEVHDTPTPTHPVTPLSPYLGPGGREVDPEVASATEAEEAVQADRLTCATLHDF
jgi:hypothetical protein